MTEVDESPFTDKTIDLINEALDTALDTVAEEDELSPFVLTMKDGEITEHKVESEDTAGAVDAARDLLKSVKDTADSYTIAYVGEVDLDDGPADTIVVEVGEKRSETAYVILQPFEILETEKVDEIDLNLLGECFIADEIENLFKS